MLHIRAHSQDDIEELKRNMRPERITFKGLDIGSKDNNYNVEPD